MFAQQQLPPPPPKVQVPAKVRILEKHGIDINLCPKCKLGTMELLATYYRGVLCKTFGSKGSDKALDNPKAIRLP